LENPATSDVFEIATLAILAVAAIAAFGVKLASIWEKRKSKRDS
jgi:hypothetical protein